MAYKLTRTPSTRTSSTVAGNPSDPLQFIELTYNDSVTGGRDWIYLPDAVSSISTCVSGTGSWSAFVEATDSPPDVVDAGNAVTFPWPLGTVSATNATTLMGATAVRINIVSGGATATPVKFSVRA